MSAPGKQLVFKFVEISLVTDEAIESAVNEWVRKGWTLDGIRFAMRDSSRRPAMAFISFTREEEVPPDAGGA